MDKVSQQNLDRILLLDPVELTVEDKLFLFARRDYLKEAQAKKYKEVIDSEANRIQSIGKDDAGSSIPQEPKDEVKAQAELENTDRNKKEADRTEAKSNQSK